MALDLVPGIGGPGQRHPVTVQVTQVEGHFFGCFQAAVPGAERFDLPLPFALYGLIESLCEIGVADDPANDMRRIKAYPAIAVALQARTKIFPGLGAVDRIVRSLALVLQETER